MNILCFVLGTPEILVICLIILLLFGGKKIPELMKGLGKGMKSFKEGMNGVDDKQERHLPTQMLGRQQIILSRNKNRCER